MPNEIVDVMVDLETLGTTPGSVVLSIGAVSSDGGARAFHEKIEVLDSLYHGLSISAETMAWWRKQSREAWANSTQAAAELAVALDAFASWLSSVRQGPETSPTGRKLRIWGDAASFDLTLLACAYRAANMPVPWDYREENCYRTLRNVLNSEKPRSKVQHDALSDARAQMEHLQKLLYRLGETPA